MKKFLSLLIALMMMAGCISAVAEDAAPAAEQAAPYTADFTISFDETVLFALLGTEFTEEDTALMQLITPLLKNLGGRIAATEEGAELSLTLKGAPVMTLGAYLEENTAKILSDLFPNYAIQIPMEEVTAAVNDEAYAQMESTMTAFGAILESATVSDVTSVETGAYTLDGFTFDTKATSYLTVQQCADRITALYSQLMADETLKPTIESLLISMEMQDLPLQMANTDFSQVPGGVEFCTYTAQGSENTYMTMEIKDMDITGSGKVSAIDSKIAFQLLMSEQPGLNPAQAQMLALTSEDVFLVDAVITPGEKETDMQMQLDLYTGMYLGLTFKTAAVPFIGQSLSLDLSLFPGGAPLATLSGLIVNSAQLNLPGTVAPATVIELDPAKVATTEDAAAMEAQLGLLLEDVEIFGLNNLMANAAAAMPEELSALIVYLMTPPETEDTTPLFDGVSN